MTQDQYNKAGLILEQIKVAKNLKERIRKDYNFYKNVAENSHLLETLEKCTQAVSVLIEIDENKFKDL